VRRAVAADLALVDAYDEQIGELESHLTRTAKIDDPASVSSADEHSRVARCWAWCC